MRSLKGLRVFCVSVVGRGTNDRTRKPRPQPRFLDTPLNFTYREGELARLECALQNLGTKKVKAFVSLIPLLSPPSS